METTDAASFPDDMTLGEARAALRGLVNDGAKCPCCTQFAKVYERKIHAGQVTLLFSMFSRSGTDYTYLPDLPQKSRDGTALAYWGLIAEEKVSRPDGGRAGWWRVTEAGESFMRGMNKIQTYVRIYDGRVLGYRGEMVSIHECLGGRFNYSELMAGVPPVGQPVTAALFGAPTA